MMDREKGAQQKLLCVTMESLMPERHFLRDLDRLVDFSFVYDKVESLYSHTGRRSVDPVVIVKMMLLGYLYGIDSERRLEQEVQVNIAFRWFLRIDLDEPVPDHSTFSQLRRRKFNETTLFEDIFTEVVRLCINHGLITGKLLLTDSTHVRANARNDLYETVTVTEEPTDYIKRLNEKAVQDGLLSEDYAERMTLETREIKRSTTDPESGCMNRPGKPTGFHYLDHQTCDSEHGLITDVFVTSGNASDCSVHSERIQHQIDKFQFETEAVSADRGYDCAEIHADMLARGIKTYIAKRKSNSGKNGLFSVDDFSYNEESDTVICPQGEHLHFSYYSPKDGVRHYRGKTEICQNCPLKKNCISNKSKHRMVHLPSLREASEKQHESDGTEAYKEALRLRQIWCEGNFSHQKANHNLKRIRMRGLGKATVHCLLSATAFNLKRMVRLLIQPLLFLAYLPYSLVDMLCRCLCWQFVNSTKLATFTQSYIFRGGDQFDHRQNHHHFCIAAKRQKGNSMNFMNNNTNPIIIGIDHGYGNIKTAHCCFKTGVAAYDKEPTFKSNLLVYEGRYYLIGEEHKEFISDKMTDSDYYILTLAAVARELNIRKLTSARVHLAAGLPLTWVSEQKDSFKAYLLQNDSAEFTFKGVDYHVDFVGADIFPQGFSAVADKLREFKGINMLCDIGNGTMNVMYINECRPLAKKCFTEKYGTNQCMLAVRENLMKQFGVSVDETVLERVIRHGTADISQRYLTAIRDTATEYAEGIFRRLREHEYDPELMRLYVVGGGSCILKNFGSYDKDRVIINDDICATAKGYELLAEQKQSRKGGIV